MYIYIHTCIYIHICFYMRIYIYIYMYKYFNGDVVIYIHIVSFRITSCVIGLSEKKKL